jgi:hypothetical protein
MTTWQHSTPQTADASERDCLKSLHRPRNESFSPGGFFLRLDDYRAGYRGSKKGRSVYLFTRLPRRVLLGNSVFDISTLQAFIYVAMSRLIVRCLAHS